MAKKSVGQRFLQIAMLMGGLAMLGALGGIVALQRLNNNIQDVRAAIIYREEEILTADQQLQALRYSIVQTQQFLSDISATRGQDGLDDGLAKAEEQANAFREHITALRKLAAAHPTLQNRLGGQLVSLEPAYLDYYKTGKAMAEAYIEGGPAKGNAMMAGFDEKAERLDKSVEATAKIIEELGENSAQQQTALLGSLISAGGTWSWVMSALLVIVIGVAGIAVVFTRRIGQRLADVIAEIDAVSHGRDIEIQLGHDDDDIADMNRALQRFVSAQRSKRQLEQDAQQRHASEQHRQQRITTATQDFDHSITGLMHTIAQTADALTRAAHDLSANAEQTQRQSSLVAQSTAEAARNVETVASASVELSASIQEIARQVSASHDIARTATDAAHDATAKIAGLEESADKIGQVISLINNIASQTNLLALNATIESARAGEAGKGFAVVANEVKHLAGQTGRATDEIAQQISSVQNETKETVDAVEGVAATIAKINELATVIAGAIEEQGAATQEIARNVEQASAGTREVSRTIEGVADAAATTGRMAESLLSQAEQLNQESHDLSSVVRRFLNAIQTA